MENYLFQGHIHESLDKELIKINSILNRYRSKLTHPLKEESEVMLLVLRWDGKYRFIRNILTSVYKLSPNFLKVNSPKIFELMYTFRSKDRFDENLCFIMVSQPKSINVLSNIEFSKLSFVFPILTVDEVEEILEMINIFYVLNNKTK